MLVQLREGAAPAVGIGERESEAGRPRHRQDAVGTRDLQRHERLDGPAVEALDHVAQRPALAAAPDALVGDRRRAEHPARHDERLVVEIVDANHGDRAVLADGEERHRERQVGVAAAAGAHGGAARGERREGCSVETKTFDGHRSGSRAN